MKLCVCVCCAEREQYFSSCCCSWLTCSLCLLGWCGGGHRWFVRLVFIPFIYLFIWQKRQNGEREGARERGSSWQRYIIHNPSLHPPNLLLLIHLYSTPISTTSRPPACLPSISISSVFVCVSVLARVNLLLSKNNDTK